MRRINLISVIIIWLLWFTLLACSPSSDENRTYSFRQYEEDGVTIAETTGGPKYSGELFDYEPVMRINEDESQIESLLGSMEGGLMDEDGFIYIMDYRPLRIVCFDADGNYSHEIGHAGQGPGEYQSLMLTSVGGGVVVNYDRQLLRLSLFKTDGTFVRSIPMVSRHRTLLPNKVFITPDERMISIREVTTGEIEAGIRTSYTSVAVQVVTLTEDTLVALSTDRIITSVGLSRHYFRGFPRAAYAPSSGIYLTTGLDPRIDIYDLNGQLNRIIRIDLPTEPVTNQERNAILSFLRQRVVNAEDDRSRERATERLDDATFCDPKACWYRISLDMDGYIWAERSGFTYWMDLEIPQTPAFRIMSPEGEYLGDTQFPINTFTGSITRGHLIGRVYDIESGSREYVIFRIRSRVTGMSYP